MNRQLLVFFSLAAMTLCWQGSVLAQHHHGGHGHGHGHGYFGGHGHYGGHGHWGGHYHGFGHVDIHLGHHYVIPHFDHHYHGSYWVASGLYYYQPQPIVTTPGVYVASKPTPIEFGRYEYVQDLTGRLTLLANDLCLDMHYN